MSEKSHDKKYIASLDIGTTSIRCFIYDINVNIVGRACANVIIQKLLEYIFEPDTPVDIVCVFLS